MRHSIPSRSVATRSATTRSATTRSATTRSATTRSATRRSAAKHPAKRLAFTLVELLVVIAIIGTLVALLLPAVQSARESARNNTCKNNIRNLALAMTQYDSAQGELPGYINELVDPNNNERGRRASWVVMLLPHIENPALWDLWSRQLFEQGNSPEIWRTFSQTGSNAPEIELLLCPSDPVEGEGQPFLSYVVNAGQSLFDDARNDTSTSRQGQTQIGGGAANAEVASNGMFFDQAKNTAIVPSMSAEDGREGSPAIRMSLNFVSANDGLSNTMMISENIHAVFWAYDGVDRDDPFTDALDASEHSDAKHAFGFVWHNTAPDSPQLRRINGAANELQPLTIDELFEPGANGTRNDRLAYPSSQHPGGVNVAFADTRVVYVRDNISNRVYSQLMTSNRKRSKYFAGDDSDRILSQPSDDQF